jgi:membrane-associated phospholipid phosphatase
MRDDGADMVTPGGPSAPLGARTTGRDAAAADAGPLGRARLVTLVAALLAALAGYASLAADVVHAGAASEADVDVATWIARSMQGWAEWLARPFTWLGGGFGVTIVVAAVAYQLVRRGRAADAVLLVVVALGGQLLVVTAKAGYERPRPDVGSAIDLPSSFSFPSGHAATGVAVFGLLGLLAATQARTRARRTAAVVGGFAVGVAIGASRVVLNVHYVTDVLAGACLGLAWLMTCLLVACWARARRRRARDR